MRFQHGELHLFLLALLVVKPMHGYELMAEIQGRLGRRYRASPGSIYPALQALETEGLITSTDDGGRRIYELTGEGRAAYAKRSDKVAAMEDRLGVKVTSGLQVPLARLSARVFEAAASIDEPAIEAVLHEATEEITRLMRRSR
jgi:DNA-binding PadR family transcriptional regulator